MHKYIPKYIRRVNKTVNESYSMFKYRDYRLMKNLFWFCTLANK